MITGKSKAKINLTLDVFEKKSEAPFHEIETIFHTIELADTLTLSPHSDFEILGNFSCKTEDNLIYKAFTLVQKFYTSMENVSIRIDKNIPEQGGLGGGSSNFATFVKLYFELFNLGNIPDELIKKSSDYGKDIPFFFQDNPCCLGTGFGEIIKPLDFNFTGTPLFLYIPEFGNSTKEMYAFLKNFNTDYSQKFLSNPSLKNIGNSFNYILDTPKYKDLLPNTSQSPLCLSGSGSSFFSFTPIDVKHCRTLQVTL